MRTEYIQYSTYVKPSWAPPDWLFTPVWSVLYLIIFISFSWIFWLAWKKKVPVKTVIPFVLNLVFNFLFTPIQFGLRQYFLASIDIVLVFVTLIWAMSTVWKKNRWVAIVNFPYLAWVSFATVLQFTITYLNF